MPTFPDSHRDLLEEQIACLATLGADGFPQVTAVWYLYTDGQLKLSLNSARIKTRNLRDRPRCSLLLLDLQNPYRYLEVRGHARLADDEGGALAQKVSAKYGSDVRQYDRPGENRVVVTVEPSNVYGVDITPK